MKQCELPYVRFDYEQAEKKLGEIIEGITAAKSAKEQFEYYKQFNSVMEDYSTAESIAYVRFTLNTEDKFYSDEMDYYDEIGAKVSAASIPFAKAVVNSEFKEELQKYVSPVAIKNLEISLKSIDESIVPEMQEEAKLSTEYKKLLSSAQIPFDGGVHNIPQLGKYCNDVDREVRKAAYNAMGQWLKDNGDKFDDIYDRMVKNRDIQAKKLGYKNYVELGYYRMGRNCYSPEDIEVFRNGVIKYWVPFVSEFKKRQAEELGVDKLYLYDNSNVLKKGNPEPIGTVEEIFENGKKMYEGMSASTGEFINFMLEHDLFDVIARKGKSGGGYCTAFPKYKMPFIFANFNGTFDDVDVLTHEAGHALAFYEGMKNIEDPQLQSGGMETCEVHSMSMEFFAWKYMELFFGERADEYRRMHFEHAVDFIPYGTMVDYFQQKVYESPEMTPAERKQLWLDLEATFRPDICNDGITYIEEGGRWQYQSHIFERPFYYIDYCLAQSVSFDFLIEMHKDYGKAFAKYTEFLKKGGTKVFTDLVTDAGFDSLFSENALANIVAELRKLNIK